MTVQTVAPARRDRATQVLFIVAALVAVSGIAFAIGRVTAPPPAAAANANASAARAFGGNGNGFGGFRANASGAPGLGRGAFGAGGVGIRGTVESVDANTLTLRLADGSTATVDLTGSTTYHKQAAATSTDIKTGGQVQVEVEFQPRASGAPASGAPATPLPSGATRTFTAADITVLGQ